MVYVSEALGIPVDQLLLDAGVLRDVHIAKHVEKSGRIEDAGSEASKYTNSVRRTAMFARYSDSDVLRLELQMVLNDSE